MPTTDISKLGVSKSSLEASLCRDSFFDFVKRFWHTIIAEEPVFNWHIEFLCNEVQKVAERVFERKPKEYDLIINISPGSTKSTICSVMFPVWCWIREPAMRMINASYAFPLALYLGALSRAILMSDKFGQLFPELVLAESQKGLLVTTDGGQRIATSTGGSITGMHGHFLIIDDPINPKEAVSNTAVTATNEWIDRTLMTRKIDKQVTPTILIMQRLHQDDPTNHLLDTREEGTIRHICLPAELSDNIQPKELKDYYTDGLMDPIRLSKEALKSAKLELGATGYAGQFMQTPVPEEGAMFRFEQVSIKDVAPHPKRIKRQVRYWDKAGTANAGAYTAGVKMAVDRDGFYWILDVVRGQWDAWTREKIIKQTAVLDGKDTKVMIEQEPGSGGKESAQNTVRNLAGFSVTADRPVGDKTQRAVPFSSYVNGGYVKMLKAEWNKQYLSEMEHFPNSKYKDQIDASAAAFAHLSKPVIRIGAV